MNLYAVGRERGIQAGKAIKTAEFMKGRASQVSAVQQLFPKLIDFDLLSAVHDYDRERLAAEPDYARYPELRGMIDRHRGERDGFREASGLDEASVAFHFSGIHFWTKRLNSRHVARWDLLDINMNGCTNVFIPDGADGPTVGDNRDIPLVKSNPDWFKDWTPEAALARNTHEPWWGQGGVSAAVLVDEEPKEIFPCNPHEMLPDECRNDIGAIKEFMTRYAEFWGPSKQIWVDRKKQAVGVEKTNRRIGFIEPDPQTGAVAVTACSYITPELQKIRDEGLRKVAAEKGESYENLVDRKYTHGADRRQHRLLQLTFAEARRPGGATLRGVLDVVADHAVPYPDRVCLAGETCSTEKQKQPEWSVTQHAAVITGPKKRMLYRAVYDMREGKAVAVYNTAPKMILGEGVAMRPEWEAETRV